MPSYNDLRPDSDDSRRTYAQVFESSAFEESDRKRTVEGLLRLREGLAKRVQPRKTDNNLLVASWNIKEFGHTSQRLPESYFYIAEIIARFDLIVVQEVKGGLDDLRILMKLLGDDWSYLVNDITEGRDGNLERSAFIYNHRRVTLAGLAGEIVLWDDLTANSQMKQLKRTPYITGFEAGWKMFAIVNVHLQPGSGKAELALRNQEVTLLLKALEAKRKKGHLWTDNLIITGDFNFYRGATKDDPTIAAIVSGGFREIESLVDVDTNASQTDAYDRMFIQSGEYFTVGRGSDGKENGGVFNPFDFVFPDADDRTYLTKMKGHYGGSKDLDDAKVRATYYRSTWRRNQLSDHLPIWFELVVDSSDTFLRSKLVAFPAPDPKES